MKGPLRLLVLVGVAVIGLFFVRSLPRDVTLVYALDAPASVRDLEVEVRRGADVLRHAEYRYAAGAPAQVSHAVKLPDGAYDVVIRVVRQGATPRRVVIPLSVSESGAIVLPVHDEGARAD
ncbi:MAG TPA: hypothetical protein VFM45_01470 [Anaeromyxobacteraceae bacterium]|nr:hypothetical protein [Anaeromyxobacteraceae bacterium]